MHKQFLSGISSGVSGRRGSVAVRPWVMVSCAAAVLLLACSPLVSVARAGWVWTPETGWMNEKYVPEPSPEEQYAKAERLLEKKKYKKAALAFYMVKRFYPDADEIERAQFMSGEALYQGELYLAAYLAFEDFLKNYPDSEGRMDAIDREIDIGGKFLDGAKRQYMGLKLFPSREKGVQILEAAVRQDPFGEKAPKALMLIADARFGNYEYAKAKEHYTRIVRDYPKSRIRADAEYKAILCEAKLIEDVKYDTGPAEGIEKRYRRLEAREVGEVKGKAAAEARQMHGRRARKDYDVAEFYRKSRKYEAALISYRQVVERYGDTEWAEKAKVWVDALDVE